MHTGKPCLISKHTAQSSTNTHKQGALARSTSKGNKSSWTIDSGLNRNKELFQRQGAAGASGKSSAMFSNFWFKGQWEIVAQARS